MRCKNYFEARKFFKSISSSSNLKQARDKLRLTHSIASSYSFDLTLSHHVHRLNAFQSSFSRMERLKAL
jgi:hypothetical protein